MEKEIVEQSLQNVTSRIWENTLGCTIFRNDAANDIHDKKDWVCAQVEVEGAWNGKVCLRMQEQLARLITCRMFDLSDDCQAQWWQIEDALKEIANMTAGNLKTELPEPCSLSCPDFCARHLIDLPDKEYNLLVELGFYSCTDLPLIVSLYKRA